VLNGKDTCLQSLYENNILVTVNYRR